MEYLNSWNVRTVNGFKLYEITLNKDQFAVISSDVPSEHKFRSGTLGINVTRISAFLSGSFSIESEMSQMFIKNRGDGPDPSRITMIGTFTVKGLVDGSKYFCGVSTTDKLIDQKNIIVQSGDSITIEPTGLSRDVFILDGAFEINGEYYFESFRHVKLTKDINYTFKNSGPTEGFILYVFEVSKDEAYSWFPNIPEHELKQIPLFSDM